LHRPLARHSQPALPTGQPNQAASDISDYTAFTAPWLVYRTSIDKQVIVAVYCTNNYSGVKLTAIHITTLVTPTNEDGTCRQPSRSSHLPGGRLTSAVLARVTGLMVRSSRGPVRASRHYQRANKVQLCHFAAGSPVRCGGGGYYHLSTTTGPVLDIEGRAGETVVRLQGPTHSPALHA
jgi:hypothetical protein